MREVPENARNGIIEYDQRDEVAGLSHDLVVDQRRKKGLQPFASERPQGFCKHQVDQLIDKPGEAKDKNAQQEDVEDFCTVICEAKGEKELVALLVQEIKN